MEKEPIKHGRWFIQTRKNPGNWLAWISTIPTKSPNASKTFWIMQFAKTEEKAIEGVIKQIDDWEKEMREKKEKI